MSLTTIENTPARWLTPGIIPYGSGLKRNQFAPPYCQLVQDGDKTVTQLNTSEVDGAELVVNGDFTLPTGWILGGEWSITGGRLKKFTPPTLATDTFRSILIKVNTLYKMTVLIDESGVGAPMTINLGGSIAITIPNGIAAPTIVTKFIYLSAITENQIRFVGTADNFAFFDNVSVKEMSTAGLTIRDKDTDVIVYSEFDGTSFTYSPEIAKILMQLDWQNTNIVQGCYEICLFDIADDFKYGLNIILNGGFASGANWVPVNFVIAAGVASKGVGAASLTQDSLTLEKFASYLISFTVAGSLGVYNIDVKLGNNLAGSFTTNGTKHMFVTLVGSLNEELAFIGSDVGICDIDNITVRQVAGSDATEIVCTDCYFYDTIHDDTMKVRWSNDEDSYGLDFEIFNQTELQLRMFAYFGFAFYPEIENSQLISSQGKVQIRRFESRKRQNFNISEVPEYIHDMLRLSFGSDNVEIFDGNTNLGLYAKPPGDYKPNDRPRRQVASVIVELGKQTQIDNENEGS